MAATDAVWMEVTANGTKLVEKGYAASVLLEEDLDHAAQLEVVVVPDCETEPILDGLDFGAKLTVELGVGTSPSRTLTLTLVGIAEGYVSGSGWRVTLTALDDLVKLKHKGTSQLWEVAPASIVQSIASEHGLSASVQGVEATTQQFIQNNLTNAEMLRKIADVYRYRMQLDGTQLLFGKILDTTEVVIGSEDRLERLDVRRHVADIPTQVDVLAWDWKTSQAVVTGTATGSDLSKISGGTDAAAVVQQTYGTVKWVVESEKLLVQGDAQLVAKGLLQQQAERFVEGEVSCLGQPTAAPGRVLKLEDIGTVDGSYRIRATRHSVDGERGFRSVLSFYSDSLSA